MLEALGSRVPGPCNQQKSIEGVCEGQGDVILLLFAGLHGNTPSFSHFAGGSNWEDHKASAALEDSINAQKHEVGPSFPTALQQFDSCWRSSSSVQFCAPTCMSTQTKYLSQHSLCLLHDIQTNKVQ